VIRSGRQMISLAPSFPGRHPRTTNNLDGKTNLPQLMKKTFIRAIINCCQLSTVAELLFSGAHSNHKNKNLNRT